MSNNKKNCNIEHVKVDNDNKYRYKCKQLNAQQKYYRANKIILNKKRLEYYHVNKDKFKSVNNSKLKEYRQSYYKKRKESGLTKEYYQKRKQSGKSGEYYKKYYQKKKTEVDYKDTKEILTKNIKDYKKKYYIKNKEKI